MAQPGDMTTNHEMIAALRQATTTMVALTEAGFNGVRKITIVNGEPLFMFEKDIAVADRRTVPAQ